MKRISLLVYLSFSTLALVAQNQHDAIWLFGSPRLLPTDTQFGGSMLDFRSGVPEASYFELDIFLDPTAIISDENGELVFYTNGCKIMNAQHEIMENGDTINAGIRHEQYCAYSYPSIQGLLPIPRPANSNKYGLFHMKLDESTLKFTSLLYSEINANHNGGLGQVTTIDQLVSQDTFSSRLSAVKHANGRDWWVILEEKTRGNFHIIYYGPEGPQLSMQQGIDFGIEDYQASGPTTLSPDGKKYVRINPITNGVHILDFDRCSGILSNPVFIDFPDDTLGVTGASISGSNQFLYVSATEEIYQFDLSQENIMESRQIVAYYDGYTVADFPTLQTTFGQLMSAPDGKIYGTAPNSSNVLHIIHAPNEQGLACNVEQHALELPTLHSFAPPNFPHFRLWDIPGSPCDTLGIDTPTDLEDIAKISSEFQLFPNPTSGLATISFEQPNSGMLQLFDISGQLLSKTRLEYATQYELAVGQYAPGLYLISFQPDDGVLQWEKLIIQK